MFNYVNEENFFGWYESTAKKPLDNKSALLNEMISNAGGPGEKIFTLPASETVSGKEESYKYKIDNIGCCGASTIYIYF